MRKKILVPGFVILVVMFVYAYGWEGHVVRVRADYCVVLDVNDSQTNNLVSQLDSFADAHGLTADKSSPVSIVYKDKLDNDVVILRVLFGDYGSVLSHYRLGEGSGRSELLDALKAFTQGKLEMEYPAKECNDIDGFKTPEYILQR